MVTSRKTNWNLYCSEYCVGVIGVVGFVRGVWVVVEFVRGVCVVIVVVRGLIMAVSIIVMVMRSGVVTLLVNVLEPITHVAVVSRVLKNHAVVAHHAVAPAFLRVSLPLEAGNRNGTAVTRFPLH